MKKIKTILMTAICLLLTAVITAGCAADEETVTKPPATDPKPEKDTITLNLITEKREYSSDGELSSTTTYTYDERGLLLSLVYDSAGSDLSDESNTYTYNEHGHLISSVISIPEQNILRTGAYEYSYNEDGTVRSCFGFFGEGTNLYLEYDAEGRFTKATTTYFTGELWDFILCSYNSKDLLSSVTIQSPESTVKYTFSYDDQDRLTKIGGLDDYYCQYNSSGKPVWENDRQYTYSESDGVLEKIEHSYVNHTYTLDELGRVTSVTPEDGMRTEYEYITVELSKEDMYMARRYRNVVNQDAGMEAYLHGIELYFLPLPNVE